MPSEPHVAQAGVERIDQSAPSENSNGDLGDDGEGPPSGSAEEPSSQSGEALPALIDGRYRVQARIGRGGTGEIFRVLDTNANRCLALKRLQQSAASERANVMLFEREYYTLLGLKHPHIIEAYDYGHDESPYYTMELLEGHDLREIAPISWQQACSHLRDIASSLALLHTRRLVHRDVSPRNARVGADGHSKLLDFGALTPFGTAARLVGTAPCTPPEAYYRMPLDQRADLYGLGAVGYWLLTRRHAYQARRFAYLPDAWTRRPPAPSMLTPGIPQALDALILSLLSLDALERPSSAADVIDQLYSIANLQPETDVRVVHAYFSTPRLVGRTAQLEVLRDRLFSAMGGEGSTVFIEAGTGLGKSRLLTEVQIETRLRGMSLVRIDAEVHRGPFAVAEALARALLDDARAAQAVENPETLALLSPEIEARLGTPAVTMSEDPGERRAVLQGALENWVDGFARIHPLVVAVDNVHRIDQASAALLLTLAQRAQQRFLLLVLTSRGSETVSAPDTIKRLRARAIELRLPPLHSDEIGALLAAVFGKVANLHRYAEWLTAVTDGNPLYTLEIIQHLVDSGVATYREGAWRLQEQVPKQLPESLVQEACEHSIARLSAEGRRLAETLSLYRGVLPLELCVALADVRDRRRMYELLNELVEKDILVSQGQEYQFRQNAIRELLARAMPPDRRKAIHRRLGDVLLRLDHGDPMKQIEAGWHLLRAGAETKGAELLAGLARRANSFRMVDTDIHAKVPALAAALDVFQRQNRDSLAQIPLLASLIESGYYGDYRVAARYSDQAVFHLRQATGLALADRLRPTLGNAASLALGIGKARVAFFMSQSAREGSFDELFVRLIAVVGHLCGIAVMCLDHVNAIRYARVLEPLSALGKRQAPAGLFDFCMTLTMLAQDRFRDARDAWRRILRDLENPSMFKGLPAESRRLVRGGAWYALGVLESFLDNGAVLECAAELDKLGLKFYEIVADRLRVSYHAYRGEEAEADRYRDRLDVRASQTGSAWQIEVWDPVASITAYARTRDRMGLRRCSERLKQLACEIPTLASHATTAYGFYQLTKGDPQRTISSYEAVLRNAKPRDHLGWSAEYGQLAAAYNAAGEHEKARASCSYALKYVPEGDRDFVVMTLELEIELAVAEAMLGNGTRAARSMDALIERYEADRGPVTLAQLYEGRCRVALADDDRDTAAASLAKMEQVARTTNNPALILRWKNALRMSGAKPEPFARFESFRPAPTLLERVRLAIPRSFFAVNDEEDDVTATESRLEH